MNIYTGFIGMFMTSLHNKFYIPTCNELLIIIMNAETIYSIQASAMLLLYILPTGKKKTATKLNTSGRSATCR
jgi:hypothetical protein